jgi:antirestriction protein ArdC
MPAQRNHDDLMQQLTDGIAQLADSDEWRRHLDVQSRFHHYSFSNVLLIAAQCPGATQVAGYRAWAKLGRAVMRGERAIWIVAPLVASKRNREDEDERRIRGFRYVPVFDIAQTEGAALPVVCSKLTGDDSLSCFDRLCAVAGSIGYTVERCHLPDGTNGDCAFNRLRIRVESRNAPAQQVKTLAHEIAHALLHQGQADRPLAELEAESTAYVVCQALGIDTSDYSFGYVTVWAGGGEAALTGVRSSCTSIQRAAGFMISALDADTEADQQGAA